MGFSRRNNVIIKPGMFGFHKRHSILEVLGFGESKGKYMRPEKNKMDHPD